MKHAVLNYIVANQVTLEMRQKYEQIFLSMDDDGNGILSREEIAAGLARMKAEEGTYLSEEDVNHFMNVMD